MKKGLIGGIGNIFFGDDGFGVEVISILKKELHSCPFISLIDFGIRTIDLALEITSGYQWAVLIDCVFLNKRPATLYLFDLEEWNDQHLCFDPHQMNLNNFPSFAKQFGPLPNQVILVGCEPYSIEEKIKLSKPVLEAAHVAADAIKKAVKVLLDSPQVVLSKEWLSSYFP
ncbi:hydrogenase maturation protease [Methylacidiphilum caldifontis]|uniref:Hydrogenase maturation protease n=1 Tax=Methylacidiphilum caldifontis TaxID=2795386 RepID=A0A4Y8P9T6_9BACT|nr:hydrogenase maturation protease [Methylacidiphilum caldifontis]TFE67523.1 hypothetical protein A7Q10_09470 [Methylacidiphilum caldifontis]